MTILFIEELPISHIHPLCIFSFPSALPNFSVHHRGCYYEAILSTPGHVEENPSGSQRVRFSALSTWALTLISVLEQGETFLLELSEQWRE